MFRSHFARRTLAALLCAMFLFAALPTVAYAEGNAPESTAAPESDSAIEETTGGTASDAQPEEEAPAVDSVPTEDGSQPPAGPDETLGEDTGALPDDAGADATADGASGPETPDDNAAEAAVASELGALTVGSSGNVNGGDHPATTAGLQAAVDAIDDGGIITLMTGVGLDAPISIPAGKSVTITCGNNLGPEYARITSMYGNNPNYAGDMFVVAPGANLTLSGLTVHGNNQVQGQVRVLVRVNDGSITLDDTKLMYANNTANDTSNTNTDNCMILANGKNANIILKNALVDLGVYHGIILDNGAQLEVYEGSEITRHKYTGVVARGGSTIILHGGSIVQNGEMFSHNRDKGPLWGGDVLLDNSTLVLHDGTIKNNRATYGSGVYAKNGSTIVMCGGSIADNGKQRLTNVRHPAQQGGGALLEGSTLNMQGGLITGNAAVSGSAVYCTAESHIVAAAGQIGTKDNDNGVYLDACLPVIPDEGMQPGTRVNIEGFHGIIPAGAVGMTARGRDATAAEAAAFRWNNQSVFCGGVAWGNYVFMSNITEVRLSQNSITLAKGQKATIGAVVYYSDGSSSNDGLSWTSSNEKVATVDNEGQVIGKNAGSAKITATTVSGESATLKVTVVAKAVKATKVSVSGVKKTLDVGKTAQLKVTVSPKNATAAAVTFASNKKDVLSVDATGKLTALKPGKAKLTVKAGGKKATITITVTAPVQKITVDKKSVTLAKKGKTVTITPTVDYSVDGYTEKLSWKSSNTKVATVSSKGKITAKGKGKATITVSAANGKSAKIKVTVKK